MSDPSRPDLHDPVINPRVVIAALWTAILFVFVYVDLFGLYRSDMRAEIESGTIAQFDIGPAFLMGVTVYVAIPSVLLALSLLLPARIVRWTNVVTAALYVPTIIASAIGEWGYFVLGSAIEVVLLALIVRVAWSWPRRADVTGREEVAPASVRRLVGVDSPNPTIGTLAAHADGRGLELVPEQRDRG